MSLVTSSKVYKMNNGKSVSHSLYLFVSIYPGDIKKMLAR